MQRRTPAQSMRAVIGKSTSTFKPWRRSAAAMLMAASAAVQAQVVNSQWNAGTGNWNVTGNWTPADVPDNGGGFTYNVQIGNLAPAANAAVTFIPEDGASDTIDSLIISAGADLLTNGNLLIVNGLTTITGAGSTIRLDLNVVPATASFQSNDLDITAGAALQMSGGIANVAVDMDVTSTGVLAGHGTLNVGDNDLVVEQAFQNSGLIQLSGSTVIPGTLVIHANGVDTIDLDGDNEIGQVDVSNALADVEADTLTLVIDGAISDGLGAAVGGLLDIGQRDTVTFNQNFEIDAGYTVNMNGGTLVATMNGPASITDIAGATLTINGDAVIANNMAFSGTANVITVNANSSLELGGTVTMPDASALAMALTAELIVSGSTTVNEAAGDFNWDGSGAAITTVKGTGALSLAVNRIDTGDDVYGGTLNLLDDGDVAVNNVANVWTLAGTLNKQNPGTSIVSGDAMNVTGAVSVSAGTLSLPVTTLASTANVTSNGTLVIGGGSTLAGPASISGTGMVRLAGTSTVTANTTISAVTFDWDGTGSGNTHTINDAVVFTINSTTFDTDGDMDDNISLGGNGASIVVNNAPGWTMMRTLTANTTATGTASIGGTSPLTFSGALAIMNVSGNTDLNSLTTFGASSTVNVDAAMNLRLNGGTLALANTLAGATINGPGVLAANTGKALDGFGTIAANVDFDGTAILRANNGQLLVSSTLVDIGTVGTSDTDGVLNIVNAWNSNVADNVNLSGGELKGGAITVGNTNGISGQGLVSARVFNSTRLHATSGTLIFQTAGNDNDWDGAGNVGSLLASSGATLELRDNATFAFTGTVQANNATVFSSGFALDFNPGSTLHLISGKYQSTNSTDIGGTLTVSAGGASTLEVQNNSFLSFESGSTSTLNGNLQLKNNNIIVEAGATFSGAGALIVPDGSHIVGENLSNIGVLLQMQGAFRPGNSEGIGRVNLFDYQQESTGELFVELRGTALNAFDRLVASGDVIADGYLSIDIDEVSPGVPFVPALGNTFNIITGNTVTGTFDYYDVSGMPAGLAFHINYLANAVQLQVVNKPFYSADFDDDGDVDLTDLLIWKNAYNLNQLGDANGDNKSDIDDWTLWRDQFGSAPAPLLSASVPEPGSFGAILGLFGIAAMRRRRSSAKIKSLLATALCLLGMASLPDAASADPSMTVTHGGGSTWLVRVAPDVSLFGGGQGSVAVELSLEVAGGALTNVQKNAALWPWDNPANRNPIGDNSGFGIKSNLPAGKVYIPLGSEILNSNALVTVATLTISGSPTVVTWGGHTSGTITFSRIAQNGISYNGFKGFTALGTVPGDADLNGRVNTRDFNLIAGNFGQSNRDWNHGDFNQDNLTNSVDFGLFASNYGVVVSPSPSLGASVPEPAGMATLAALPALLRRPRR